MKNFGSGGAISFHIGPIFKGWQPFEELKLGVQEPVLRQNWRFGPILWPLMNIRTTKHYNLNNFRTRGTTGFDFGASSSWKWPIECLWYHEHDQYSFISVFFMPFGFFNALATQLLFVFPGPPDIVSAIRGGCIVVPFFFCILNPKHVTNLGVEWFYLFCFLRFLCISIIFLFSCKFLIFWSRSP